MRKEIADRANELFAKHMDLPPVYDALMKEGMVVSYPQLVEFFDRSPLSRKLPLEKFIEGQRRERRRYIQPAKQSIRLTKKINNTILIHEKIQTNQNLYEKIEPKIQEDTTIRDELYSTFVKLLNYKAREEGWAAEQAIIYDAKTKRKYDLENTINVLSTYQKRKNANLPFSEYEISVETTADEKTVKKILKNLNLLPKKTANIDDKMDALIRNALKVTEINLKEAAHFLNIPVCCLKEHIKEKRIPYFKKTAYPNFIEASKVYEAVDAGFNLKETSEYVKTNQRNTEYAILRRAYLEPQIIEILKRIYPDREIKKPYL